MSRRCAWPILVPALIAIGCQTDALYFEFDAETRQRARQILLRTNAQIERNDKHAIAYSNRSVAKWRLGDHHGAVDDASRAIALDPSDALNYVNRSAARLALKDRNGAINDAHEAIALDPLLQVAEHNLRAAEGPLLSPYSRRRSYFLPQFAIHQEEMAKDPIAASQKQLDQLLKLNPKHQGLHIDRSRFKERNGDLAGAIRELDRAMELNPTSGRLFFLRADLKLRLGDHQGARADYDKAIELVPYMIDGYGARGLMRFDLGDHPGAFADFAKVIEMTPKSALGHQTRGVLRAKLHDRQGALEDFSKAIDIASLNQKTSLLNQSKGQSGNYWVATMNWRTKNRALFYRGVLRLELGDHRGGVGDLDQILGQDPQPMPEDFLSLVHAYRGNAKAGIGHFRAALSDYASAMHLDPKRALPYLLRANLYVQQGRMSEAMQEYDRAAAVEPTWVLTYIRRARLKQDSGDFAGALQDYSLILETGASHEQATVRSSNQTHKIELMEERTLRELSGPSRFRPWALLGRSLVKRDLGDLSAGLADLEEAARHAAQTKNQRSFQVIAHHSWCELDDFAGLVPDEVLAQGWNHKIKAHFHRAQGEWQQAVSMYTKILEGNPTDAMTYVHRSRSKTRLGDQSGALSDLNQAVNLLPGRPDFLAQRSLIKDAIGDLAGSAVDARFALNLHDQLHVIWAHRAEAKRRLGNYHGALDDATLSLKLDPSLVKALLTRGASHLALGNKKEASRDLAHARKLAPEEGPRVDTLLTSGPEPCLTALPSHGTRVRDAGKCACSELVSVTEASDMLGAF